MRRYEEYKHSGIDWIPTIPKNWKLKRVDEIAKIVRGNTAFKKDELLEIGKYVALQYGKTYKVDEINQSFSFYVNDEFYKSNQIVKQGDTILISTSETIEDLGHTCYYNRTDLGLLGGEQLMLRPNTNLVSPKFLYYFSKYYSNEIKKYATGLKVYRYNIDDLKNIFIPVFSVPEQQAIANYLDAKTQAIDKKISLLEQKIETYKKLKRTLINQTITKGLNKNVPLKDSGISWIGQIPQHWEVKRFKDVLNLFTGNSISDKNGFDYIENSIPYVATKDIDFETNEINYQNGMYIPTSDKTFKRAKEGTCLLCIEGANAGKKYGILNQEVAFVNKLAALKFKANRNFDKYLYYYIQSNAFSGEFFPLINGLIGGVSVNKLKEFTILLPPKSEQEEIAKYLDHKTTTIDAIVGNISKQIDTLKQLRKTLINDVVTGKIKVIE